LPTTRRRLFRIRVRSAYPSRLVNTAYHSPVYAHAGRNQPPLRSDLDRLLATLRAPAPSAFPRVTRPICRPLKPAASPPERLRSRASLESCGGRSQSPADAGSRASVERFLWMPGTGCRALRARRYTAITYAPVGLCLGFQLWFSALPTGRVPIPLFRILPLRPSASEFSSRRSAEHRHMRQAEAVVRSWLFTKAVGKVGNRR
jgi:hypothetical protein